jgi:crossover junction endodeoxyribonuclease RuvC
MLVIGIDPGTARTGYGLVRRLADGGLEPVEFGVFTTSSKQPLAQRLLQLFGELSQLLELHRPDSGAVEKLFFQRNVSSAMSVSHARGVAMLALARHGLQVMEYSPREVKQAIVGYGNAEKRQMQEMTKALLNLPDIPRPDDAADGLAVAICHIHSEMTAKRLREGT